MNPFEQWLPLYGPGVVAERPWWRCVDGWNYVRLHGNYFILTADQVLVLEVTAGGKQVAYGVTGETITQAMARIDREDPVPVPPPMCGQVWVQPSGEQDMVGKVYWTGSALMANGNQYAPFEWPPAECVLVAGPTHYGRDVPWAPGPATQTKAESG